MNQFEEPDEVVLLKIETTQLPPGDWRVTHYIKRQVVSVVMSRIVTEFVAEVMTNGQGQTLSASMPEAAGGESGGQTSGMIPVEEFELATPQRVREAETLTVKPEPVPSQDEPRAEFVSRKTPHNFRALIKKHNLKDAIFNKSTFFKKDFFPTHQA